MYKYFWILLIILLAAACTSTFKKEASVGKLRISDNGKFFAKENGEPFFWLGDTGWLLFAKLNREDAEQYLENRRQKGFNVIQAMVLHEVPAVNVYGDAALVNQNVATPKITEGNTFADSAQYDFWDHVDYVIDKAAEKGIYMALVPVWGSNVKDGFVTQQQAATYATWLAERYKDRPNIIWLNGGDIRGDDSLQVWQTIGCTLQANDPNHLVTFHPRGRTQSSMWFHDAPWLDFNMFQSGHRRYDQDSTELNFGEDNWRYVQVDYQKEPVKPTLDGEPSYENIPQGLHDTTQPRWKAKDVRRYGYWSVFAGACGFTYGDNAVMQMHKPSDEESSFGAEEFWYDAIHNPGAGQMIYLKKLMLSRPYFERVPDQSIIADQGDQYDYLIATRGKDYAFIYTYTGRNMKINMGKIARESVKATWYSPRDGDEIAIGIFPNQGVQEFNPPGMKEEGNDWVLILDAA